MRKPRQGLNVIPSLLGDRSLLVRIRPPLQEFGERAALLLTTLLEGDDITSRNTAVTTDTMRRDLPGIKKLAQMGPAHPQALCHLSGRVVSIHVEQGDGAAGRERVGQGEEKITQCALAEVAGKPGE